MIKPLGTESEKYICNTQKKILIVDFQAIYLYQWQFVRVRSLKSNIPVDGSTGRGTSPNEAFRERVLAL